MQHPAAMRFIQGIRDLRSTLQHQELGAVLISHVVQHANMRMVQAGDRLGLALKALPQSWVVGEMRRKNLDGDSAVQARISRSVDFTHSSCADGRNDLVWAESDARGQCHLRWIILLETEGPASYSSWLVFTDEVKWLLRLPLHPESRGTQKPFRARSPVGGRDGQSAPQRT